MPDSFWLRGSRLKRYDLSGFFHRIILRAKKMFSGIIEDFGKVADLKLTDEDAVITIRTQLPVAKIKIGDSISVNGACLTVISKGRGLVKMDVSAETLRRTSSRRTQDRRAGEPGAMPYAEYAAQWASGGGSCG